MKRKRERQGLARAKRLFDAGRYPAVIRELEPRILLFRESSLFHFLLAASCLQTGDSGGASTYAKRSAQLDPRNADARLVIAAIALRRGDLKTAATEYLSVLEIEPENRKAAKALEFMRKASAQDVPSGKDDVEGARRGETAYGRIMLDESDVRVFYPSGKRISFAKAGTVALISGGVLLLVFIISLAAKPLAGFVSGSLSGGFGHQGKSGREGLSSLDLRSDGAFRPDPATPVPGSGPLSGEPGQAGSVRMSGVSMTEKEIRETYRKAVRAFGDFNDNGAIIEANRLLRSNAGKAVRQKAEIIKSYCADQDPATVKFSPSFRDVLSDRALHSGCVVRWKGRLVNFDMKTRYAEFLAGYEAKDRLDGIVSVRLPQGAAPDTGHSLEIFAKVGEGSDGTLLLDVILVRDLAFSENR